MNIPRGQDRAGAVPKDGGDLERGRARFGEVGASRMAQVMDAQVLNGGGDFGLGPGFIDG
jgi:hypothetical protein